MDDAAATSRGPLFPGTDRRIIALEVLLVIALVVLPNLYTSVMTIIRQSMQQTGIVPAALVNKNAYSGFFSLAHDIWLIIHSLKITLPLIVIIMLHGERFADYGFIRFRPADIVRGFVRIMLTYGIFSLGLLLAGIAGMYLYYGTQFQSVVKELYAAAAVPSQKTISYTAIAIGLLPLLVNSFAEEFVFRSFLYNKLRRLVRSETGCMAISSLLFASYHFYQGLAGVASIFCFGMALSLNFRARRNIYTLIFTHTMLNLAFSLGEAGLKKIIFNL